jgi:hypothetical protein
MEKEKIKVVLSTSVYHGRYGVIKKVTAKKFKIRFWDTGNETYLLKTSVLVLSHDGSFRQNDAPSEEKGDGPPHDTKRRQTVKRAKASKIQDTIKLNAGEVTKEEWDAIVSKVAKLFI